jgi:hypothetical protein
MTALEMRLLSFLTEIENKLRADSPALTGGAWQTTRMVNFHNGLARLHLSPRPGNDARPGTIFLQAFSLADGSLCLKASLQWEGADAAPVLAVYSTPKLNWKLEASRIASVWMEGPQEFVSTVREEEALAPLMAVG